MDTHSLLNQMQAKGYEVNGLHLTMNYLGGLVTLDGLHPTNTLQAIIANDFIDTMNARFGLNIPDVNVSQVATADPLVMPALLQSK